MVVWGPVSSIPQGHYLRVESRASESARHTINKIEIFIGYH